MGLFSWITADTQESIRVDGPRTVYLLRPHGAEPLEQPVYEGYGVFGGVDAYDWLADMNEVPASGGERRGDGIDFFYRHSDAGTLDRIKYPLKFSYNKDAVYEDLPASGSCPYQGFFYDEEYYEDSEDDTCSECGRAY